MRYMIAALLALFLLTGCTATPSETTRPVTTQPLSTDPGIYIPDSDLEMNTDGAVRVFDLGGSEAAGILTMGNDILLLSQGENGLILEKLTGENCRVAYTTELPPQTEPQWLRVEQNALAYYDSQDNSIVLLDGMLHENGRLPLPEALATAPVISNDLKYAYYAVADELRALELSTGTSRLLRTQTDDALIPMQTLLSDTLLECSCAGSNLEYISAEDGRTVAKAAGIQVSTWEDRYFAATQAGDLSEYLFGAVDSQVQALYPQAGNGSIVPLLSRDLALCVTQAEAGTQLDIYDLQSGKRTASVILEGIRAAQCHILSDDGGALWFAGREASGQMLLCRWSFSDSPVVDDRDYTDRRFTADDPDTDGLKLCQERGNAFFEDYGVAVQVLDISAAEGFTFTPEYRVPALMRQLDTLGDLLKPFPESFFAGLEEGKLTLLLVDSITDAQGNSKNSLSYWENGTGRIVLTGDGDIRLNFYTALSYVLEAHIYANSLAFDEWSKLNPKGFAYDNAFDLYADRTDSPWLEGEERAFVDSYSMTFPREDRARIFAYAMMEDQEAVFASPTMQAKLRQLCKAIREAFDWEKTEESYPWEQYLAQ